MGCGLLTLLLLFRKTGSVLQTLLPPAHFQQCIPLLLRYYTGHVSKPVACLYSFFCLQCLLWMLFIKHLLSWLSKRRLALIFVKHTHTLKSPLRIPEANKASIHGSRIIVLHAQQFISLPLSFHLNLLFCFYGFPITRTLKHLYVP